MCLSVYLFLALGTLKAVRGKFSIPEELYQNLALCHVHKHADYTDVICLTKLLSKAIALHCLGKV